MCFAFASSFMNTNKTHKVKHLEISIKIYLSVEIVLVTGKIHRQSVWYALKCVFNIKAIIWRESNAPFKPVITILDN